MEKIVYLVNERLRPVQKALEENGFEVLVGQGEPLNEDYLRRCTIFMPGRTHITADMLDMAPNLKLICKQGIGLDRIDLDACKARGIEVRNTPGSNSVSVAEHAVTLMLACAKQLFPMTKNLRIGTPDPGCAPRFRSMELAGKTLSVIGFGNIGSRVAAMAHGFDMRIVAYEKFALRRPPADYVELTDNLDYALAEGDFISLHVSGVEENRHLIGKRELAIMKNSAILINTTRGFIVDEDALFEALTDGQIAAAGLDVFEHEPVAAGNRLLGLDNVFATPHSAANTPESNARAYEMAIQIILDFVKKDN